MQFKRSLLVGATLATVTLGGGSIAMAATDSSTSGDSLAAKIASKFNLNQEEVEAVFDEDRTAREAERKADFEERLSTAVTDGNLPQEQADHIKSSIAEIDALRGDESPREVSDEVRDQIKDKMDELRQWADDNDVDTRYLMGGRGHAGRGFGAPRDTKGSDDPVNPDDSSSSSDSSDDSSDS